MFPFFQSPRSTEGDTNLSSVLLQHRALEQLRKSLTLIPLQQQSAYREALARCPSLLETESDPLHFLLFADFNVLNAATRLVTYWEERREVFGERAFLPVLDLSGNGALAPEDVKLIATGSFMLTAGDTVVVDSSLQPVNVEYSRESQTRRTFFFLQLFARHRGNAIHGKGCQFVVKYDHNKPTDPKVASKTSSICSQAFPIRLKAVHVVFAVDYQLSFLRNAVIFMYKVWGSSSSNLILHHCETPVQALVKLIPHGVLPSALPRSLGGSYQSDVEFARFLEQFGYSLRSPLSGNPSSHDSENQLVRDTGEDIAACNARCLNEAIDNLPGSEKAAYMLAKRLAPELVEEESPPLLFLELENFDSWAAATRICKYWRYRLEVFQDRAFLPMTIDGAMGPEGETDVELKTQYLLRNDKFGRSVWCAEPLLKMSSDPEMDFKMRVKALYYTLSKILKNPKTIRDGFMGIAMVCQIEISFIDSRWRANILRAGAIFKESFPVRPITTQVIFIPTGWGYFTEFCCKFLIRILKIFVGNKQNVHFCLDAEAQEQLYRKFEEMGISKEGLPKIIGGQDGPSEFLARQRLEESRSASPSTLELPEKLGGQDGPSEFLSRQRLEESRTASPSTLEVSESAVKDMRAAISLIPNENKVAYLEALNRAPELAEQESLWKNYLRFTSGDAAKAAGMFVKYWEVRKELFGNRAFLPLNQTFEGALERKDVAVLQTGYFMQLPCVRSGESVLYCDGTKLQKSSSSLSRVRSKFYMLSLMAENPVSQSRGFNLLYLLSDPSFDRVFKEHFIEKILPVMPVRLNDVHILGLDVRATNGNFADGSVEARMNDTKNVLGFQLTGGSFLVERHVCASREDLFKRLARHGFSKEGLPKTLFGVLGYDDFVKWQELRVRYEWGLFTNNKEVEISSRYLIPRNKLIVHEQDSEKVERKRRMTIILSRKKRERERMSFEELQEEAMEQTERHRKLQRQNETLQELIVKAKGIVNASSETDFLPV